MCKSMSTVSKSLFLLGRGGPNPISHIELSMLDYSVLWSPHGGQVFSEGHRVEKTVINQDPSLESNLRERE